MQDILLYEWSDVNIESSKRVEAQLCLKQTKILPSLFRSRAMRLRNSGILKMSAFTVAS